MWSVQRVVPRTSSASFRRLRQGDAADLARADSPEPDSAAGRLQSLTGFVATGRTLKVLSHLVPVPLPALPLKESPGIQGGCSRPDPSM